MDATERVVSPITSGVIWHDDPVGALPSWTSGFPKNVFEPMRLLYLLGRRTVSIQSHSGVSGVEAAAFAAAWGVLTGEGTAADEAFGWLALGSTLTAEAEQPAKARIAEIETTAMRICERKKTSK